MLVEFSLVEFGLLFHLSICHAFHNFLTSNKIYLLEVLSQLLRWAVRMLGSKYLWIFDVEVPCDVVFKTFELTLVYDTS